jgi:dTDP-4-dehydrorhamnose reductase
MTQDASTSLIIGARSRIGRSIAADLQRHAIPVLKTSSNPEFEGVKDWLYFDLATSDPSALPLSQMGSVIICAGITNFNACETDPRAQKINVDSTASVIDAATALGVRCYFLSSNAVFADGNYVADSTTERQPNSAYGTHKLCIEDRFANNSLVSIIRSTKVFHRDHPLIGQWRSLLRQGNIIELLPDSYVSPISMDYYLSAFRTLFKSGRGGLLNLSGQNNISYLELAQRLFTVERHRLVPEDRLSGDPRPRPRTLPLLDMSGFAAQLGIAPQSIDSFVSSCCLDEAVEISLPTVS